MRRYIPGFLLLLAASAPLTLGGCTDLINKLKGGGGDDAGVDAAVVAEPEADGAAVAVETDAAEPEPTVAPTTTLATATATATATTTAVQPTTTDAGVATDAGTKTDAATAADAGAATTDAGPAPAPTPTLKIPTTLLDAGLGPMLKLDAGGLRVPWQK